MVTLPPPYRNLKDVSAHQRPQQRPVSLDHGTEGVRLAGVFPNEPLKDGDFLGEHADVVFAPAGHPHLFQASQRHSGERHAAEVLGRGFAHAGQRGADDGGGQW